MAKQVKISTSWSVTGGIMSITVETRALDAKPRRPRRSPSSRAPSPSTNFSPATRP